MRFRHELLLQVDWDKVRSDKEECLELWERLLFCDCLDEISPYLAEIGAENDHLTIIAGNILINELISKYPIRQAKAMIKAAGVTVLSFLATHPESEEKAAERLLDELDKLIVGEVPMDWDEADLVEPNVTPLTVVFSRFILQDKVDFMETIPSLEALGN